MRSFMDRNRDVLYDEVIHVPLLFFGKNIPSMKIPKLARHVDILPTVCSLCNLSYSKTDYDGANLSPMFGGNKMEELVAYIESGPSNKDLDGKVIGIRTSRYKYFRSRTNPSDNTHLYDKLNDPSEERNIAKDLPETVNSMEKHLLKLQNDTDTDELSDSERDMIQEELKKLGYI